MHSPFEFNHPGIQTFTYTTSIHEQIPSTLDIKTSEVVSTNGKEKESYITHLQPRRPTHQPDRALKAPPPLQTHHWKDRRPRRYRPPFLTPGSPFPDRRLRRS